jgi:hypothetical protein
MKTYRGRWCIGPFILNFSTRWKWMANFTPWLLQLQERTPIPIE